LPEFHVGGKKPGVYLLGETPATDKLGLKLTPESGERLAEFQCRLSPYNPYIWRGGFVIVPITSNKTLLTEALKYRAHYFGKFREEQLPPSFVGEAPDPLEGTEDFLVGEEKPFVVMGWITSTKLFNEGKIEANSVL
jgi:hypothetical protein